MDRYSETEKVKNPIRKILKYFKYSPGIATVTFLIAILIAGTTIATPYMIKIITEDAISKERQELYMIIGVFVGILVAKVCLWGLGAWANRSTAIRMEMQMRKDALNKMYTLTQDFFDTTDDGKLVSRIVYDIREISNSLGQIIMEATMAIIALLGGIIYAFIFSWLIACVTIGIYIIGFVIGFYRAKKMEIIIRKYRKTMSEISEIVTNQVHGITEIKSYSAYDFERERYELKNKTFLRELKDINVASAWFMSFSMGTSLIIQFGITLVSVVVLLNGGIDVAEFSGFMALAGTMVMPLNRILALYTVISQGVATSNRFLLFLDLPSEKLIDKKIDINKGDIEFKNVDFHYTKEDGQIEYVLKNFNLKIPSGKKIAFVGKSGIGKSTILKLIMRFYDIQGGQILIDGQDIAKYNINNTRKQLLYIQQSGILFNDTIKANIIQSNPKVSQERLDKAVANSGLLDIIDDSIDGWKTQVGSKGNKLSGGQKQRVAIARALLVDTKIMLLDEATASLDNKTEKIIQKSFNDLSKNKTSITVAHRITTIQNSDIIYLLGKQGKIIEHGSHDDMMKNKSSYYNLVQGGEYE